MIFNDLLEALEHFFDFNSLVVAHDNSRVQAIQLCSAIQISSIAPGLLRKVGQIVHLDDDRRVRHKLERKIRSHYTVQLRLGALRNSHIVFSSVRESSFSLELNGFSALP